MSICLSAGLSYQPGELVTAGIDLSYLNVILRDTEHPLNTSENGTREITLSPNIGIRYNTWDGYFLNEKQALLKYGYMFVIGGDDVHSVSLSAAFNHSGLLPRQFDHGPVAMLQMYFSRVAMPGVGLGAAYNVDKNVWQYAINAGMTF